MTSSSSMTARASFAALSLALAACPDSTRGPVSVPQQLVGNEPKDCYEFRPEVFQGSRAPAAADRIVARCEDPRVCTAELHENGEVFVYGEAPGTTSVFVAFDHPFTHSHEEHHVRVVFEAPPRGGDWLHPRVTESRLPCPPRRSAPSVQLAADGGAP